MKKSLLNRIAKLEAKTSGPANAEDLSDDPDTIIEICMQFDKKLPGLSDQPSFTFETTIERCDITFEPRRMRRPSLG